MVANPHMSSLCTHSCSNEPGLPESWTPGLMLLLRCHPLETMKLRGFLHCNTEQFDALWSVQRGLICPDPFINFRVPHLHRLPPPLPPPPSFLWNSLYIWKNSSISLCRVEFWRSAFALSRSIFRIVISATLWLRFCCSRLTRSTAT